MAETMTIDYLFKLLITLFSHYFSRNKDRQIEEAAEKNEDELKFYKQKVKHLQYEHQNSLTECKAQALVSLKTAQDEHTEQEKELLRDKKNFKNNLREQENAYEDQIKNMRIVCTCLQWLKSQ